MSFAYLLLSTLNKNSRVIQLSMLSIFEHHVDPRMLEIVVLLFSRQTSFLINWKWIWTFTKKSYQTCGNDKVVTAFQLEDLTYFSVCLVFGFCCSCCCFCCISSCGAFQWKMTASAFFHEADFSTLFRSPTCHYLRLCS